MTYKEVQKFSQPWLWIGLIISGMITTGIFGSGIYRQVILGHPFGNHPMSNNGLIAASVLVAFVFLSVATLLLIARLTTIIDGAGIAFRFFPFQVSFRRIDWDEVETSEVVTYNPVRDYGGWGVKSGKKGKAFNVCGDKGLALHLKKGKNILIGTQKDREMRDFLAKLNRNGA